MTYTTEEFRPPRASEHSARRHVPKQVRVPPVLDVASMGPDGDVCWNVLECARVRPEGTIPTECAW